jgi:hypothetical protein
VLFGPEGCVGFHGVGSGAVGCGEKTRLATETRLPPTIWGNRFQKSRLTRDKAPRNNELTSNRLSNQAIGYAPASNETNEQKACPMSAI